jgi:hypothetical protein
MLLLLSFNLHDSQNMRQVGEKLTECIQRGIFEAMAAAAAAGEGAAAGSSSGLLALMQDPMQARQKDALARIVRDLENAWSRLKVVSM